MYILFEGRLLIQEVQQIEKLNESTRLCEIFSSTTRMKRQYRKTCEMATSPAPTYFNKLFLQNGIFLHVTHVVMFHNSKGSVGNK